MSPLVQQCQKVLNDISTQHAVGLFWVPGHSRVRGNEIADKLARDRTVHHFVGQELALAVSRQNIRKTIKCWIDNQHMVMWRRLISTHRQAQQMILGPRPSVKTRLLYFNSTQSRVVTSLLTVHNSLRRHLHFMGLSCIHLCRRCGAEEGTSIHFLCECEALASIIHAYLVSFFLDPEDINSVSLAAIWNFSKGTGFP